MRTASAVFSRAAKALTAKTQSTLLSVDWLRALDFDQARHNCHNDILGDWYRDPWSWPEIAWVVERALAEVVVPRLDRAQVFRPMKLDVAKENFAIRPAVVIDPIDRLIYQSLVDASLLKLHSDIREWTYGWRVVRENPKRGVYSRNDQEWQRYRDHLKRLITFYSVALVTDVVSFFASIPIERLTEDLFVRLGRSELSEALVRRLHEWDRAPGRAGLVQRSAASAALAHMFLAPVDRLLARESRINSQLILQVIPEGRALRWMDDIWLFGRDPGVLRKTQISLQRTLDDLGLNMNLAKTALLEGDDVRQAVQDLEHSAADAALADDDTAPLEELVDRFLLAPETTSRTTVGFITKRMREHQLFTRVPGLVEVAHRAPHGADHLARLFRDSDAWRGLDDWYIDYANGAWGSIEWSVAQLGTMFPSAEVPPAVRDFFAETIRSSRSLPYVAVALQRLGRWDADEAKLALRDSADVHSHPLQRRVMALVAVDVADERRQVRQLLDQDEQCVPTLRYLEHRRFRRVPLAKDFG